MLDGVNAGKGVMDSIYWVVDGGVVLISNGSSLDTDMRTQVYNVSDLLVVVPNFTGPRLDLSSIGNSGTNGANGSSSSTGLFGNNNNTSNNYNSGNGGGNNGGYGNQQGDTQAQRLQLQDTLIQIIRDATGDELWEPTGRGHIRILNGKLIISQTRLGFKLLEKAMSPH